MEESETQTGKKADPDALYQQAEQLYKEYCDEKCKDEGQIDYIIDLLRRSATQGHPQAQIRLARLLVRAYRDKVMEKKQMFEAKEWLLIAARPPNPNPEAMWWLGWGYRQGIWKEMDEEKEREQEEEKEPSAFYWFQTAADLGHLEAFSATGRCYKYGRYGAPKSLEDAKRYYMKGAELGDMKCAYKLAALHVYDDRDPRQRQENDRIAAHWFEVATQMGHRNAPNYLANFYLKGRGGLGPDPIEALKYYLIASRRGSTRGINNLGTCYLFGYGVAPDPIEAVKYFEKAACQETVVAQLSLGQALSNIPGRETEGFKWVQRAAEHGDAKGLRMLGQLFEWGLGVSEDIAAAFHWYVQAADKGNTKAAYEVGCFYEEGRPPIERPNHEAASHYYTLAAAAGYPKAALALQWDHTKGRDIEQKIVREAQKGDKYAQYLLGTWDKERNNKKEALRWYTMAADQGMRDACIRLGVYYQKGKPLLKRRDVQRSCEYLLRALREKSERATIYLGKYFEKGRVTESVVFTELHSALLCLVSLNKPEAHYLFGKMYEKGIGVEWNVWYAKECYQLAASADHPKALFRLGWMLERMEAQRAIDGGVEELLDGSKPRWFGLVKRAGKLGNRTAQYWVGYTYLNGGPGVQRKSVKAEKWLRRLAEKGVAAAQYLLAKIVRERGDTEKAVYYLREAALRGYVPAQREMLEVAESPATEASAPLQTDALNVSFRRAALRVVPIELSLFTRLQVLDLSCNRLRSIPPFVCALQHLRSLLIADNDIQELPSEIGNLKKLTELDVSKNKLRTLPSELGRLHKLKYLSLWANPWDLPFLYYCSAIRPESLGVLLNGWSSFAYHISPKELSLQELIYVKNGVSLYKGTWKNAPCAIKMFPSVEDAASPLSNPNWLKFCAELSTMIATKDILRRSTIQLLGAGQCKSSPFLVTELPGPTLYSFLKRRREPLDFRMKAKLLINVSQALNGFWEYTSDHLLKRDRAIVRIHGAITLQNISVMNETELSVKFSNLEDCRIFDFFDDALPAVYVGVPWWYFPHLSPVFMKTGWVSPKCDLYGFGVLAYQVWTDTLDLPLAGGISTEEAVEAGVIRHPRFSSPLMPRLPKEFLKFLKQCCSQKGRYDAHTAHYTLRILFADKVLCNVTHHPRTTSATTTSATTTSLPLREKKTIQVLLPCPYDKSATAFFLDSLWEQSGLIDRPTLTATRLKKIGGAVITNPKKLWKYLKPGDTLLVNVK